MPASVSSTEAAILPESAAPARSRSILGNIMSMLTNDVVLRATTFVLYLLVGRYLGTYEFGQMSLALTLFYTAQEVAVAGLKTFITREVTTDLTTTNRYLINGSAVSLVASLVTLALMLAFVRLLDYSADTASVILLMAVSLLPYALSTVCEAIFQAWERMHFIAYTNIVVNVVKIGGALFLLTQGYGLYAIILLVLVCHAVVLVLEWGFILWRITRPSLRLEPRFMAAIVRASVAFMGINALLAVRTSLNVVLLSKMASEVETGLYSAATQLTLPIFLILESVGLAIFPVMCQRFGDGVQALKGICEDSVGLLLMLALPAAVGLSLLATPILVLVYGETDFAQAAGALEVVSWVLIVRAFTHVLGRALWASKHESQSFKIILVNTSVWFVLGMVLISQFSLIGAALTLFLSEMVNFFLHYIPVSRILFQISLPKVLWKPLLASLGMGLYLLAIGPQEVIPAILSAGIVYLALLLALELWSAGGAHQLKTKYLNLWSE